MKYLIICIFFIFNPFIFSQVDENSDTTAVANQDSAIISSEEQTEVLTAKENLGFSVGIASSVGFVSGDAFTSVPTGVTAVIATPYGFNIGSLRYSVSLALGGYTGSYNSADDDSYVLPDGGVHWTDDFNPVLVAVGGNLSLSNVIFTEGHVGLVGEGLGFRGFAGISLERIFANLKLPINVLVGGEGFVSSKVSGESASYWAGTGFRIDFNF